MILGLMAQTSVHAGASNSEAAVDLPIQREGHTDWPVIVGSGVKGAMRGAAEISSLEDIDLLFGPDTKSADEHAGSLLISDARLVLLPVRSLTSHVKWVTCPALFKRLRNDMTRMGFELQGLSDYSMLNDDTVLSVQGISELYLEEFRFNGKEQPLSSELAMLEIITHQSFIEDCKQNMVIVSNDQFRFLCRNAIPVQTHIAIDSESRTVINGALWYEESLPAETLMYSCISCATGRNKNKHKDGKTLLSSFKQFLDNQQYLQVGGNVSTGMGWFETKTVEATS